MEMDYVLMQALVRERHSVREYTDQPVGEAEAAALGVMINRLNEEYGLAMRLVTGEADAFGRSIMARYGHFRNVTDYMVMASGPGEHVEEKLGYCGEWLVLEAQRLGLNTCWVGMTFGKGRVKKLVRPGEKVYAVIALGHGVTQGAAHKIKTPEQVCPNVGLAPKWVHEAVDCALLAPTAVNQQKFRFEWIEGNRVKATTSRGFYAHIDLGIACLHFEIGAARKIAWQ